ncbi:MAG: GxxExxY protein [Pontiellaceae bacterium]|nr:GxxExxY protein [Pontiellaceae bacterium]
MKFDELSNQVIGCALKVHKELGPGLLESAYEQCLCYELLQAGLKIERQKALPVEYGDVLIDCGYRIDVLVENRLLLELKSVDSLQRIHEAQLLTYMKLSSVSVGLLINFNSMLLKDGIKRLMI